MLKVGEKIKDFKLLDSNGNAHTLSEHLGKNSSIFLSKR